MNADTRIELEASRGVTNMDDLMELEPDDLEKIASQIMKDRRNAPAGTVWMFGIVAVKKAQAALLWSKYRTRCGLSVLPQECDGASGTEEVCHSEATFEEAKTSRTFLY